MGSIWLPTLGYGIVSGVRKKDVGAGKRGLGKGMVGQGETGLAGWFLNTFPTDQQEIILENCMLPAPLCT